MNYLLRTNAFPGGIFETALGAMSHKKAVPTRKETRKSKVHSHHGLTCRSERAWLVLYGRG